MSTAEKTVRLGFDPEQAFGDFWRNETARMLWLLWRPDHIVGTDFSDLCVTVADRIDRAGKPMSVDQLIACFPSLHDYWSPGDVRLFANDHIDYFNGAKVVDWHCVIKAETEQ